MNAIEMLQDAAFDVLEATSADKALQILEARHNDVAVLFTDINMPGPLDGLHLVSIVDPAGERPMSDEMRRPY